MDVRSTIETIILKVFFQVYNGSYRKQRRKKKIPKEPILVKHGAFAKVSP